MATRKSIVFDLDGTLIDVWQRHYQVYCETISIMGGNCLSFDKYRDSKRENQSWAKVLTASELDSRREEEFLGLFVERIEQPKNLLLDTPIDQVHVVLENLGGHYDLYLATLRHDRSNLVEQLNNLKLEKSFKEVVSSAERSPDVKTNLIRSLPDLANALVVGDTELDIRAAKDLGFKSVAVTSGMRNETELRALNPDFLLPDISTLESVLFL